MLTAGCLRLDEGDQSATATSETASGTAPESETATSASSVSDSEEEPASGTDEGDGASTEGTAEEPNGSVVVPDQETDGSYVSVAKVQTNVEAIIQVYDGNGDFLANPGIRFEPGETRNDVRIDFESTLSASTEVTVRLFWCEESGPDTCNGPTIATDTATLSVTGTSATQTTTTAPSGLVVLDDQETDGTYVTVSKVQTNVEAIIQVYDANGDFLANPRIRFEPGETRNDIRIEWESALSNTQEVTVKLFWCEESGPNTCNGPTIARDTATLTVD
ncbi:hypothetical protein [Halorubellus litoreus]|uniref:CARDB protein n=1 Tax=Halorubellus litoreus TaxID=755308 RepID=A0ABD5VI75_9EURY